MGRNYFSKSRIRAGFTLTELLIAIAIIGILASSAIIVMNPAGQFAKTHDAQRKNDLEQIRQALDTYYSDNNSYPPDGGVGKIDGKDWGTSWSPYMAKLPKDPLSDQAYRYESPIDGDAGAYRLYAKLERCSDSQTTPGVDCLRPENYSISSSNLAMLALLPTPTPTPTPTPIPKTVFVTSEDYKGDLGGLTGADNKCGTLATAAGLTGDYRAWLSDGATSAKDRLAHGGGAYKKTDGTIVADSWSELTSGKLKSPINFNENGLQKKGKVLAWTNTKTDGSLAGPNHCDNWTSGLSSYKSITGWITFSNTAWTFGANAGCNTIIPLYCFEQ